MLPLWYLILPLFDIPTSSEILIIHQETANLKPVTKRDVPTTPIQNPHHETGM